MIRKILNYRIFLVLMLALALIVPVANTVTVRAAPVLSISPTSGPPRTFVTVFGSGFSANETGITVTFDGYAVVSGITADSVGNWNNSFYIPSSSSGYHPITAYGSVTPANSVPIISFLVQIPTVTISPTKGSSGTVVTVTGTGFGVYETGIAITFDGNVVASGFSANSLGNWSGSFNVPTSTSGLHTVGAYGFVVSASSVAGVTFSVSNATISIGQTSGPPGTSVAVTGSGFSTSETGITITFDGNPNNSGISADSLGNFVSALVVPASASGSHTVGAYGSVTPVGSVTGVSFTVTPIITTTQTSGAPGTSVTVTGAGFSSGETGITVTFDGNQVGSGTSASSLGSWVGNFEVPAATAGTHSISARGLVTQTGSVNAASFKVTPIISMNPTSGYVGENVQVTGSGFAANSPLTFTYDSQQLLTGGSSAEANGSFSQSISIPKSIHGNHVITVADSQRNNSKVTFAVESTPPPVPNPTSPADGARLGIIGDVTPTFRWSGVTDPSGVTYDLQVDTTPDFSSPILEKTDISANSYTVPAMDALPLGQYYWRVKAIDGASNESSWSQAQSLKSGLMALWLLVLLIVLAVAAVIAIIWAAIIRPSARKREAIPVPFGLVLEQRGRAMEAEELPREQRQLPLRLALPEPARGGKTLSTEDQARLQMIVRFAQSLPLVEPDFKVNWLVDLVESGIGTQMSLPVYEQLLKGDLQVRYEPPWISHPAYQDLTLLLQKQPVLRELNTFVADVDRSAGEAASLIQRIYKDAVTDIPADFLERGGWKFVSTVYADAMSWFTGESLGNPSERDYSIKPKSGAEGSEERWLYGEGTTSFAGELILAHDEKEALKLRALHLRLRRTYRSDDQSKQLAATVTQLQLQRSRLLNTFNQLGQVKQ